MIMKMKNLILGLMMVIFTACGNGNVNNMCDFTYANNIPIIGDTINNEVVHFIVDTGASISLINSDYMHENEEHLLVIGDIGMNITGIAGIAQEETSRVAIVDTSIGQVELHEADLRYVIRQINKEGYNVVGLIGSDFLRREDYIINYKTQQITKCN